MMDSIIDNALDEAESESDSAPAETSPEPSTTNSTSSRTPSTSEQGAGASNAASNASRQTGSDSDSDDVGVSDAELQNVLTELETTITVVGCGGAGGNTVNRIAEAGIHGAELIAANTDVQHLVDIEADTKILLGEQKTKGRGAGAIPQVGEEAALESQDDIRKAVDGSDMVFVTCGLGGGTGTGASPVVAEAAKEAGALTIAIVTQPFTAEGEKRRENADAGLARLREVADTVIVIPNDRLLDAVGNMPIQQAFQVADEILMRSVKGITELITTPGLVNLDFSDVTTIMESGDLALIGLGEADSSNKAQDAVRSALKSPLLDVEIGGANSLLVNVTGGSDMAIEEAEGVVEELYDRVDQEARIIWGASVNEDLEGEIRTLIVATGVESPQIYGSGDKAEVESTVGNDIDFIE